MRKPHLWCWYLLADTYSLIPTRWYLLDANSLPFHNVNQLTTLNVMNISLIYIIDFPLAQLSVMVSFPGPIRCTCYLQVYNIVCLHVSNRYRLLYYVTWHCPRCLSCSLCNCIHMQSTSDTCCWHPKHHLWSIPPQCHLGGFRPVPTWFLFRKNKIYNMEKPVMTYYILYQ